MEEEDTSKQLPISALVHRIASKHKINKPHKKPTSRSKKNRPQSQKKKNHDRNRDRDHDRAHRDDDGEMDGEDEKEEVERKIEALQRIVPGGERLAVDKLFEETAGYIMALQCQLKAMKALANLFQGLEKDKSNFGG